jgi:tetratricopeptide (TPR) repeat protein
MGRIEKTVFLSYRRTNAPWALAISQNLTHHGYDVFFDFNGIASGDFESVILENIRARAHFVVLLTPSALERCGDPGDWLRREIETALEIRRNIVPLMLEGFDYGTPTIATQLTGTLAPLKSYNALRVPVEYFDEAMERLRTKFLNLPLDAVLHPASASAVRAAKVEQAAASAAPAVTERELTAQEWFERGLNATDRNEKLRFYSEAIRLQPDYAKAFVGRSFVHLIGGHFEGAIEDCNEAIRIEPDDGYAFYNRGDARHEMGDLDGALQDYNEAVRLMPDNAYAFANRARARYQKGDLDGALQDYNEAVRLMPDDAYAFANRARARHEKGDLDGALQDYNEAVRLKPDYAYAFFNRGNARRLKGDIDGAIQDYDEAIRFQPNFVTAYYNRALIRGLNGHTAEAIADFQKYLDLGGGERDGDAEELMRRIQELKAKL